MALCFKLPQHRSVIFPNECFVCGAKPEKKYKVTRRQLGAWVIFATVNTMSLRVPVCEKHYRLLQNLQAAFWLLLFAGIGLLFSGQYYFAAGIGILTYLAGRKYFAIRNAFAIVNAERDYIVYSSNREDYLLKLCALNDTEIFAREPFTGVDYR